MTSILHVAQPVDGGVGRFVAALAASQRDAGLDVVVASPPGRLADEVKARDVPWRSWSARRAPGAGTIDEVRRLRKLGRERAYDVIHLHSSKAGMAGRLALRGRRPTIFQPHGWSWDAVGGTTARLSVLWERQAARWTTALVCVSDAERLAGIRRKVRGSYHVIPNGVDLDRFRAVPFALRQRVRSSLGLDATAPTAVCVGRFSEQKGHRILLHAWTRVSASAPDAKLVLVGSGPLRDALMTEAAALGVASDVEFVGEQDDIAPWYAAADVVALSSRWGEAMALTPLEAMACGRAVVASDVNGVRESVAAGCGAIVPAQDAAALGRALTARLTDPTRAEREGRAGRRHVAQHHDSRLGHRALSELACQLAGHAGGESPLIQK